jgi:hypothetical protein
MKRTVAGNPLRSAAAGWSPPVKQAEQAPQREFSPLAARLELAAFDADVAADELARRLSERRAVASVGCRVDIKRAAAVGQSMRLRGEAELERRSRVR